MKYLKKLFPHGLKKDSDVNSGTIGHQNVYIKN